MRRRRSKVKIDISTMVCPDCGKNMFIPRGQNETRKEGHYKSLWCPFCKEQKQMLELRERDFY